MQEATVADVGPGIEYSDQGQSGAHPANPHPPRGTTRRRNLRALCRVHTRRSAHAPAGSETGRGGTDPGSSRPHDLSPNGLDSTY